jgi:hypothetical protein
MMHHAKRQYAAAITELLMRTGMKARDAAEQTARVLAKHGFKVKYRGTEHAPTANNVLKWRETFRRAHPDKAEHFSLLVRNSEFRSTDMDRVRAELLQRLDLLLETYPVPE